MAMKRIYTALEIQKILEDLSRELRACITTQRSIVRYIKEQRNAGTLESDIETQVNTRYTDLKAQIEELRTKLDTSGTGSIPQFIHAPKVEVGRPALYDKVKVINCEAGGTLLIPATPPSTDEANAGTVFNVFDDADVVRISGGGIGGGYKVDTAGVSTSGGSWVDGSSNILVNPRLNNYSGTIGSTANPISWEIPGGTWGTHWTLGQDSVYPFTIYATHATGNEYRFRIPFTALGVDFPVGTRFRVKFTIGGYSGAAHITPYIGDVAGTARSGDGTYEEVITSASYDKWPRELSFQPASTFVGAISLIELEPVDVNALYLTESGGTTSDDISGVTVELTERNV